MSETPSWSIRWWRMLPWNPSPLMRGSDRFEIVLRFFAAIAVVVAVPVAGAAGTAGYTGAAARIAAQDAGKSRVEAQVTEQAVRLGTSDRYGAYHDRYEARVRWTFAGTEQTAKVEVDTLAQVGEQVPLWIDRDGKPATAPTRAGAAAAEGIGTGLALLVETWCAAAASVWIASTVLESRRNARWEREWRELNRPIGKDTL
ncbi:Rv1733c family protein [Nocardia sp. NPDC055321]